eukprot:ANDGO_07677.mRNA.1 hypothetical protein
MPMLQSQSSPKTPIPSPNSAFHPLHALECISSFAECTSLPCYPTWVAFSSNNSICISQTSDNLQAPSSPPRPDNRLSSLSPLGTDISCSPSSTVLQEGSRRFWAPDDDAMLVALASTYGDSSPKWKAIANQLNRGFSAASCFQRFHRVLKVRAVQFKQFSQRQERHVQEISSTDAVQRREDRSAVCDERREGTDPKMEVLLLVKGVIDHGPRWAFFARNWFYPRTDSQCHGMFQRFVSRSPTRRDFSEVARPSRDRKDFEFETLQKNIQQWWRVKNEGENTYDQAAAAVVEGTAATAQQRRTTRHRSALLVQPRFSDADIRLQIDEFMGRWKVEVPESSEKDVGSASLDDILKVVPDAVPYIKEFEQQKNLEKTATAIDQPDRTPRSRKRVRSEDAPERRFTAASRSPSPKTP